MDHAALQSKSASMRLAARVHTSKPTTCVLCAIPTNLGVCFVRTVLQVSGVSGKLHSYPERQWWLSCRRARLSGFSGGRRSRTLFLLRPE